MHRSKAKTTTTASSSRVLKPCGLPRGGFSPPPDAQVSAAQALAVRAALRRRSASGGRISASLLVFGLGNDAPMWQNMTSGRVAFVEDSPLWVERVVARFPRVEAHVVNYSQGTMATARIRFGPTQRFSWPKLDLRPQLPSSLRDAPWDVVIVDAPMAGAKKNPGRQQSIYTAAHLVSEGGTIFIDDCERENERFFGALFLGAMVGSVKRDECIGHDHLSGKAKRVAQNRRCEYRAPKQLGGSSSSRALFGQLRPPQLQARPRPRPLMQQHGGGRPRAAGASWRAARRKP